jgi:hypothetical protein
MAQVRRLRNRPVSLEPIPMRPVRKMRDEMRGLTVLFAVFALLIQALMPTAAMASRSDGPSAVVICTATGSQILSADGHLSKSKGFAGMPCQDCLAAAMAIVATPELAVQPVAYTAAKVEHAPVRHVFAARARAPPRPPGQGPPTA